MNLNPGWRTSEHWAMWGLLALCAWDAWTGRHSPAPVGAVACVAYILSRTLLKIVTHAAWPQGASMDLDATIDAFIKRFVASKVPATAALQPECDAALVAAEALAHKALEVYAVKLIAKKAPQLLTTLQQAFPNAGL